MAGPMPICRYRAQLFCGMWIAECGKLSTGNLWKIMCGTFRKLPLIAFPHSAAEKFGIFADCKTTVRSHCTTNVRPLVKCGRADLRILERVRVKIMDLG